MPRSSFIFALLAGLFSSLLFLLVFGLGLGFIFMFLPTLPLLFLGLRMNPGQTHIAALVAAILIAIAAGFPAMLTFVFFLGIPAIYITRESVKWRSAAGAQEWFPVGIIMLHLALYASGLVAAYALYCTLDGTPLPQVLAVNIREALADLQDDYGDIINAMAGGLSFLVFPMIIWLWGIALYIHAWAANRILRRRGKALRPDFAVRIFTMPGWMLTLLAICALASLVGGETMAFLGKSTLLALMLPYFFAGAALMHSTGKTWSSYRFFVFFVYFLIFTQFWPALILAGIGLWHQIKHLSDSKR